MLCVVYIAVVTSAVSAPAAPAGRARRAGWPLVPGGDMIYDIMYYHIISHVIIM